VIKGFRDFITRGNVLDLAVAVVIGTAFTAVVTSVVENLINPVIAAIGSPDTAGLATPLRDFPEATINWDAIVTALINFFIIAAVVYAVFVAPMNRYRKLRARGDEDEPGPHPRTCCSCRRSATCSGASRDNRRPLPRRQRRRGPDHPYEDHCESRAQVSRTPGDTPLSPSAAGAPR
jgi:large conductance mechanosensitive channel